MKFLKEFFSTSGLAMRRCKTQLRGCKIVGYMKYIERELLWVVRFACGNFLVFVMI